MHRAPESRSLVKCCRQGRSGGHFSLPRLAKASLLSVKSPGFHQKCVEGALPVWARVLQCKRSKLDATGRAMGHLEMAWGLVAWEFAVG